MKEKKKCIVSVSFGESSMQMAQWLQKNKSDEYNFVYVFANTGEEEEETLLFGKKCQEYFDMPIIWVEYSDNDEGFKIVNFDTAYRSHNEKEIKLLWPNHPFRKMIAKYGIPNIASIHCTRELKENPIRRYLRSIGWKANTYFTAIGYRSDEMDRINPNYKIRKHYYPLLDMAITKPMVNFFWKNMPFRLNLKGYEGNCKTCYKKSFRKLGSIACEHPERFDFFRQMEIEYSMFINDGKKAALAKKGTTLELPLRFFREKKTVDDIFIIPQQEGFEISLDDKMFFNYQTSILHDGTELDLNNGCVDSCELFSA